QNAHVTNPVPSARRRHSFHKANKLNGSGRHLCHNIAACAPPALPAQNVTSSSASSASRCSKNGANGKPETASRASVKPDPRLEAVSNPLAGSFQSKRSWGPMNRPPAGPRAPKSHPPPKRTPSEPAENESGVRLQKYLAEAGIASRRASESVILAG